MQNILLEHVSEQFLRIIEPRLNDLAASGHCEYLFIKYEGGTDIHFVIEDNYFLCMVVLFWATVCEAEDWQEVVQSLMKF